MPEEYRIMSYPQPERGEQDKAYMGAAETQQADAQAAEPQQPRPVVPIIHASVGFEIGPVGIEQAHRIVLAVGGQNHILFASDVYKRQPYVIWEEGAAKTLKDDKMEEYLNDGMGE